MGVMVSKGRYIIFLQSGYILLFKENLLYELYNKINNNIDILEFNLLINKNKENKYDRLTIYECAHIKEEINVDILKTQFTSLKIGQEKELLFNKLIKGELLKSIINKYKLIYYKEVIYNYYDNILFFILIQKKLFIK